MLKGLRPDEAYYWATHNGAEIDLVLFKNGRRIGVECKRADAPALTPSMRIALVDLKLDELHVVYSGDKTYRLYHGSKGSRLEISVSSYDRHPNTSIGQKRRAPLRGDIRT